jgi:hypothetical protein
LFVVRVEAPEFAAERPGLVQQLARGAAARKLLAVESIHGQTLALSWPDCWKIRPDGVNGRHGP